MHKNELPSAFTDNYWNLMVTILWTYIQCVVRWENQQIVAGVWTWVASCCLEGLSPQLMIWTGKRSTRLFDENQRISQRAIVEKLHIFSAGVRRIIVGLG